MPQTDHPLRNMAFEVKFSAKGVKREGGLTNAQLERKQAEDKKEK